MEKTLKITYFQLVCHGQGHLPVDQDAQGLIQTGLEPPPEVEHPQLLWTTCASASPLSE